VEVGVRCRSRGPAGAKLGEVNSPLQGGARRVGVEAFFVEEEDAGTEGEEPKGRKIGPLRSE